MPTRVIDALLASSLPIPVMLPATPESPRVARRLLRGVLADAVAPDVLADIELLTSELVTNAIVAAGTGCALSVSVPEPDVVKIAVADFATEVPEVLTPGPDQVHGRGMLIVEKLSRRWGVEPAAPVGKRVWFEMPLTG